MTRVYISGPITGLPEAEYTARFKRAEEFYKSAGFEVVNPVEIGKALQALKDEPTWNLDNAMTFDTRAEAGAWIDQHGKEWVDDTLKICEFED